MSKLAKLHYGLFIQCQLYLNKAVKKVKGTQLSNAKTNQDKKNETYHFMAPQMAQNALQHLAPTWHGYLLLSPFYS